MSFILTSYLSTIYAFFWDVLYSFWMHEETVDFTTEPYIVSTNSGIAAVEDIEGIVKEISLIAHDPLKSWPHSPTCPQERWRVGQRRQLVFLFSRPGNQSWPLYDIPFQ